MLDLILYERQTDHHGEILRKYQGNAMQLDNILQLPELFVTLSLEDQQAALTAAGSVLTCGGAFTTNPAPLTPYRRFSVVSLILYNSRGRRVQYGVDHVRYENETGGIEIPLLDQSEENIERLKAISGPK
jgi:hypothetical protein